MEKAFYEIQVRPKRGFVRFKTYSGSPGHLERLVGKRSTGTWDTVAWLVAKEDAHITGGQLVIDEQKARSVLQKLVGPIVHQEGDTCIARPQQALYASQK